MKTDFLENTIALLENHKEKIKVMLINETANDAFLMNVTKHPSTLQFLGLSGDTPFL